MLSARGLGYTYGAGPVLNDVDLEIGPSERVALLGPSGSGKSTLLHCLAGILVPTSGVVALDGEEFGSRTPDERAALRLRRFGFVFQFGELVPELTLRDNVELPLLLLGADRSDVRARGTHLLTTLGIADVADRRTSEVSGGQAQRCAIARALVHRPQVLFADEPTGALDSENARQALDLLLDNSAESGAAVIVVTHDPVVAGRMDRIVELSDGRVLDLVP